MSYIRVLLTGGLPGGESWSVSPAFNETTDVLNWDQLMGQDAADAIAHRALGDDLRGMLSTAATLVRVRVERRADSHELIGAAEQAWTGGGSTSIIATKPYQTSLVCSLRTNVPGGRGRGRIYWPALGAPISETTLRVSPVTTQAVATAMSAYLDGIETDLKNNLQPVGSLIDYRLCVVSLVGGFRTDVQRIDVGDVLDVQRRRRDKAVEAIKSAVYPPA